MNSELAKLIGELQSREECHEAWDLVSARADQLEALESLKFHKGMKVAFEDKHGNELVGIIETVNQKTATLRVDKRKWRVAFSFLREVAA